MNANYNQRSGSDAKSAYQSQMSMSDQSCHRPANNPTFVGDEIEDGGYMDINTTPSPKVVSPNNGREKKKLNQTTLISVIIFIFGIIIAMVSCGVAVVALEKVLQNNLEDTTGRIQQLESRLNELNDSVVLQNNPEDTAGRIQQLESRLNELNVSLVLQNNPEDTTGRIQQLESRLNELNDYLELKSKAENNTGRIQKLEEEIEDLNSRWTPDPEWFSPSTRYQYRLTDVPRTWTDRRDWCRRQGGDLAAVGMRDIELRKTIYDALPTDGLVHIWIGLSDTLTEGRYYWSDGVLGTSSNIHWASGEPNNALLHEDCCEIPSHTSYLTNDNVCRLRYRGICEKLLR